MHSSLEGLTPQLSGAGYNELTGPGYHKGLKQTQHSATSLPPLMPKYSSFHTEDSSEHKKLRELIPIYSIPDKSKKEVRQKEKEQIMRKTEVSGSQTTISPASEETMTTRNSPSPPPPELPPKPGVTRKSIEKHARLVVEREEPAYEEASSKLLPLDASRNTATAERTTSPLHLQVHNLPSPEREVGHLPRLLPTEDNLENEGAHTQQQTDTEPHLHYDMPLNLSLFSNDGGGRKTGSFRAT